MNSIINNEILTLEVSKMGAELQSIRTSDGTEYLWQGNPKYWSGRAINLFPYCARLTDDSYYLDDKLYQMAIHGIAMYSEFEVVDKKETSLTLELKYNEETLKKYPRKFVFDITYKLVENRVEVTFEVLNKDNKMMYFGIGGHPGFNVPLDSRLKFEDYYLEFADRKELTRVNFTDDCFPDGTTKPLELNDSKLKLEHNLFDRDAIVVEGTNHSASIKTDKDKKAITISFPQMKYLGIWHMPHTDAPYICLEPWVSLPSRKGIIEKFEEQADLIKLMPGEKYINNWYIQINE